MENPGFSAPDWETLVKLHGQNLPHWFCERAIYHLSFRLVDALPAVKRREWLDERQNILDNISCQNRDPTDWERTRLRNLYSERIEAYLDAGHGECWLAKSAIGGLVADVLEFFNDQRYHLHSYCIMPNHVHVLADCMADWDISDIVKNWKIYSAKHINRILGRKGRVWQSEPFDHIVRTEKEYRYQLRYIWENPGNMRGGYIRRMFAG
ncbi:MAG: transposase [Lentisphaeria bacterium]|nr:transposase [Lentisphaeria bacterium]